MVTPCLRVALLVICSAIAGCNISEETSMWTQVSATFIMSDKPYGAGDFRILGQEVISLKRSKPETATRPMTPEELADPTSVAEYTETWMSDPSERANRRSTRVLVGSFGTEFRRTLEEQAQRANWSLTSDSKFIYLATGWSDYRKSSNPGLGYAPQLTKLFKSANRGKDWQQLSWPENFDISCLRFLDSLRGYAIGWGPRIWRTADGGDNWVEIPVPAAALDPADVRKQFDAVVLGNDGVLRVAFATRDVISQDLVSQVHALRWDAATPSLAFTLPNHTVADLADHPGHLYILAWKNQTSRPDASSPATSVFYLGPQGIELRHEFAPGFKAYALYVTPSGGLLADGVDEQGRRPEDLTAISYDAGKSWKLQNEGASAQGGYYDTQTGTRWRVVGYSLYKRHIP